MNEFLFTKIEEEDIRFGFNRTALRATQPKLHSMFCALFLKISLSAAELMSCNTAEAPLDVLRPVFEDLIISRRADVV